MSNKEKIKTSELKTNKTHEYNINKTGDVDKIQAIIAYNRVILIALHCFFNMGKKNVFFVIVMIYLFFNY